MSERELELRGINSGADFEGGYSSGNSYHEFNKAMISGVIEEEFEFSHGDTWENFYRTRVMVARRSGTIDYVPIIVSDFRQPNILEGNWKGMYVEVAGQFRSYNKCGEDGLIHLELYLFASTLNFYDSREECQHITDANCLYLDGYICRSIALRTTPLSNRRVCDIMLAVKRGFEKTSHIPCLAWNSAALYASKLKVGERIKLYGRIQSREYFKRYSLESEDGEMKMVYEVSIIRMKKVEG